MHFNPPNNEECILTTIYVNINEKKGIFTVLRTLGQSTLYNDIYSSVNNIYIIKYLLY